MTLSIRAAQAAMQADHEPAPREEGSLRRIRLVDLGIVVERVNGRNEAVVIEDDIEAFARLVCRPSFGRTA